jgi:hypothetical protein
MMPAGILMGLMAVLALALERASLVVVRWAPGWGRPLLEGIAPFLYGLLPLLIILQQGWLSLREVGLIGPTPLAPDAFLGWSVADWVRGLGLTVLYSGITALALRLTGLCRLASSRRLALRVLEALPGGLGREALLGLWRGVLQAAGASDPLPVAWLAFGIWWGAARGLHAHHGHRPGPWVWGGALAATTLFSLTGNLWLSAITHLLVLALLGHGEALLPPEPEQISHAHESAFSRD